MRNRLFGFVLILVLLAGGTTGIAAQDFEPTVTYGPCPPLYLLEIEGETVECGTVTVPEDYSDPEGDVYEIAFVVFKARSQAPFPDPVIYLEGGPGAASLINLFANFGLASAQNDRFDALRQFRDVIWFDQRSTGLSTGPLDCSTEISATLNDLSASVADQVGEDVDEESQTIALSRAVIDACLDVFEERGTDVAQVNTENNARDVALLAQALGYEQFNLFGISYGTRLALEVMHQNPDGLRSVVLDSVSAPDVPGYAEDGIPFDEALQQLFVMCANDEACNAAYPDLQARFAALLEQLEESPLEVDGLEIDTTEVLQILEARNGRRGISAYIPLMIYELEQGITDTFQALSLGDLPPRPPEPPTDLQRAIDARSDTLPLGARLVAGAAAEIYADGITLQVRALLAFSGALSLSEEGLLSLPERFDEVVTNTLGGTVSRYALDNEMLQAYLALPLGEATPRALITFAITYFSGFDRDQLIAFANAMTTEEIEQLFDIIHNESLAVTRDMAHYVSLLYYVCNENIPFNSFEGFEESRSRYAFPQVADLFEPQITTVLSLCEGYPDTWEEAPDFHAPVVSAVPTLIFVGNNDIQTAFSSGRRVLETLENGQLVEFPDVGHGAIVLGGQCAQDIASGFINAPMTAVNTTCVADLLPEFALPPESAEE